MPALRFSGRSDNEPIGMLDLKPQVFGCLVDLPYPPLKWVRTTKGDPDLCGNPPLTRSSDCYSCNVLGRVWAITVSLNLAED